MSANVETYLPFYKQNPKGHGYRLVQALVDAHPQGMCKVPIAEGGITDIPEFQVFIDLLDCSRDLKALGDNETVDLFIHQLEEHAVTINPAAHQIPSFLAASVLAGLGTEHPAGQSNS